MEILSQQKILEKRAEVERELLEFLQETGSDFSLDHIKDVIYNEDSADAMTDIIAMFDTGQGGAELQTIIETINDAWNYFPHEALNGLSPAEKVMEYQQTSSTEEEIRQLVLARLSTMPDSVCLSIGTKTYTKEQLIQNVEQDTEVGREIMAIDIQYLRDLTSGKIYDE